MTRGELARYYFLHLRLYSEKLDIYRYVDPLIRPILESYYASNYYYRELDCYRSQPVPASTGSYDWHRDNYPPGSIKAITYLTDVASVEDGPLVVAAGSHLRFKPELGLYGPRVPKDQVEGRYELEPCLGPAGTIVLFNNNSIHRAANPSRGYREVLNTLLLPSVTAGRPAVKGTDVSSPPSFLQKYTR